jgi:hypothetical protein
MANAVITAVMIEQRVTKRKEASLRKAIVLKNNSFSFMVKEPVDGRGYGLFAAQVLTAK